jgi:hypothetical protein
MRVRAEADELQKVKDITKDKLSLPSMATNSFREKYVSSWLRNMSQ